MIAFTKKILIILSLVFLPIITSAQTIDSYNESLRTVITPANPQPNQTISITLESSLVDLSLSTITWSVDGKIVSKSRDNRKLETKLKDAGKETKILISVSSPSSGALNKEIVINPASIDLIYEANTYTPPFYKGKALPSAESSVTLLTLPKFFKKNGAAILAKDLMFTWKKDGVVDGAKSGLGKNTYTFATGRLPENTPLVEVSVLSPEEGIRGYSSLLLPTTEPQLVIYEDNPILGVNLNQAVPREGNLNGKEMSLVAYPYFFSGKNKESQSFEYTWYINNEKIIDIPKNKSTLTIRSPEGIGSSSIRVSLSNINRIFQAAASNILVKYGE